MKLNKLDSLKNLSVLTSKEGRNLLAGHSTSGDDSKRRDSSDHSDTSKSRDSSQRADESFKKDGLQQ